MVPSSNASTEGGAIYLSGGRAFVDSVEFYENQATAGGAVYIGPGAQLTIASAEFKNNNATGLPDQTNPDGSLVVRFCLVDVRASPCDLYS